nr:MAG TPA: hypothetical protein [Bacteriophage sp.]
MNDAIFCAVVSCYVLSCAVMFLTYEPFLFSDGAYRYTIHRTLELSIKTV